MKDVTQLTGGRSPRQGDDVPAATAPRCVPADPPAADASRSPDAHEPGSGGGPRAPHLPVLDKDFACPAPRRAAGPEPVPGQQDGADVEVSAHALVGDLLLRPGRRGPAAACDRGPRPCAPASGHAPVCGPVAPSPPTRSRRPRSTGNRRERRHGPRHHQGRRGPGPGCPRARPRSRSTTNPGVSQATRERILEAARELCWAPSAAARSLSSRRVDIVGLALCRPARLLGLEPFYMDFVSGIESVLAERSASLLLRLVRDLDEEAAVYEEWWRGRMIAGAILADFREDDSRVPALRGLGLPAVAVGHPSLTGPFPAVWTDDASAVAEAVRYLAALGHRRIARVGGPTDLGAQRHPGAVPRSVIRARAFADTTRAPGVAEARQIATGFDEKEGARATRRLLLAAEKTRRPQAVSRVASKPVAMSRYSTPAPLPLHDQPRYPTPSCCAVDMMTFLVRIAVRVQVAEFPDDDGKTLGSEPVEVIPSRCPRC